MQNKQNYTRIVTHHDLDGIVSAALCGMALNLNQVVFTGPGQIERRFPVTKTDVVCDLPYPGECGLWFDHHAGNLEALQYRQIDPATLPGHFAEEPSCARVVYSYFKEAAFPHYLEDMVYETDRIDGFLFQSLEEWREETPGHIVDMTIRDTFDRHYFQWLFESFKQRSLKSVSESEMVQKRYDAYKKRETEMLQEIENLAYFLDQDKGRELIVLDLTHYRHEPKMVKNLAYLKFPEALGVLAVRCLFRDNRKTNHLHFSMSLSIRGSQMTAPLSAGEIMRTLNMGDGHAGAAAGNCHCSSKSEMLKQKDNVVNQIYELWSKQRHGL